MATSIEWTDETWNPVSGCTRASAGCDNCYAVTMTHRLEAMGQAKYAGLTVVTAWLDAGEAGILGRQWDRSHELAGTETEGPGRFEWTRWKMPLPTVWLGTSVENQQAADERIPHLLQCPAAVRFLSVEPLFGAVDLANVRHEDGEHVTDALNGETVYLPSTCIDQEAGIDWVIVGGESGHGARPCSVVWIRSIIDQCRKAGVPVFVKQLGAEPREPHWTGAHDSSVAWMQAGWPDGTKILTYADPKTHEWLPGEVKLKDRKGGTMEEWPEDLRVRQMPEARHA